VYNEARNKGFKRPFMNIMSSKGWENRWQVEGSNKILVLRYDIWYNKKVRW
jgi:hypothetical protein